jgi:hypothetical protein
MTVSLRRNGQEKLRLPVDVKTDGTLWAKGIPLINSTASGIDMDKAKALVSTKKYSEIPIEWLIKLGDNAGGLVAVDTAIEQKAAQAAYEKENPGAKEYAKIMNRIYIAKKHIHNFDDYADTGAAYNDLAKAESELAAWKIAYPKEAAEKEAEDFIEKAEKEESQAVGAMIYDCDGSLGYEDQVERRDAFLAKAKGFRAMADEVRRIS